VGSVFVSMSSDRTCEWHPSTTERIALCASVSVSPTSSCVFVRCKVFSNSSCSLAARFFDGCSTPDTIFLTVLVYTDKLSGEISHSFPPDTIPIKLTH
jgi:hypothetical protein